MEQERINKLIGLWLDGETDSAQEKELRAYFSSADSIPEGWQVYKTMFEGFDDLSREEHSHKASPVTRFKIKYISIGVAASVAIFGCLFGIRALSRPDCYINGKPVRDVEVAMYAAADLSQLSDFEDALNSLDELDGISADDFSGLTNKENN